jgi:hypothetical protein
MSEPEITETPEQAKVAQPFYLELAFKTRGIIDSYIHDTEELRVQVTKDFAEVYGEGNFELRELRLATVDEVNEVRKQAAELQQLLDEETSAPTATEALN